MITLSDQISLSLPLPTDSRTSNLLLLGSNIKVETIAQYLERIDINDRYLGLEVIICTPPGIYQINTFMNHLQVGNISFAKYKFATIADEGLVLVYDSVVIINDLTTGGTSEALSAEQGKILKSLVDNLSLVNSFTGLGDTPNSYVGYKDKTIIVNESETGLDFINRTYLHDQGIPSGIWNITHDLNKFPSVTVKTSSGDTVEGFINYVNKNAITIIFNAPFSGTALLN